MHAKQLMTALAIATLSSTTLVAAHAATPSQPASAQTQDARHLFASWGAGYVSAPTPSAFGSVSDSAGTSGVRNVQSGAPATAKSGPARIAADAVYGVAGPAILVP